MIETADTRRTAISVPRLALGLGFLVIGAAKLTGSLQTVDAFAAIGWGQWLRYVVGLFDIVGALLVLVPGEAWHTAVDGIHGWIRSRAFSNARPVSISRAHIAGRRFGLADSPKHSGAAGSNGIL
jgi:hypothetical protein